MCQSQQEMRLEFVYDAALMHVGHTEEMTIYEPFSAPIGRACAALGWRENEWSFMWHQLFPVAKTWTPDGMGAADEDDMRIYCVPREANN